MISRILEEVDKLTKKYKTRDPFEIAKGLNIDIIYHDLGNLKGYYYYQSRMKYIVINNNISEDLKPMICAHELGHDRLHLHFAKNFAIREFGLFDMSSKPEREANLFAAELLVDETRFLELVLAGHTYSDISSELSIPIEIINLKYIIHKFKVV
ncbi:ImmA/IrrE family metallo-endopeptidase [Acetoanaerobium noterae]|uniref:ImmA/IrrE family metallo-endopeptidase n=1 Tax=Acetoanaerobium noterae TaxID=745369 RepID=UPI003327130B